MLANWMETLIQENLTKNNKEIIMRIKVGSKTIYNVKIYKPCGKHYMVDGLIKEGDYCLYTTIPEITTNT